eukprot:gene13948-14402_t
MAAAFFGADGRTGGNEDDGMRTYAVLHLIAPSRDGRDAGPRRDEFDAIKRHGAVAEILIVNVHVGCGVVAEPFLHILGKDLVPPPPVAVDSVFDWDAPSEGLPSAFSLLLAWDFLLRAKVCLVYAQVGGTAPNIGAWMSFKPSLHRDVRPSRPTLGILLRRGDHVDFLRAIVHEAALHARRRVEHPGQGAPSAALDQFEESARLRLLADNIRGERLPERLGVRQLRVIGTVLRRLGPQLSPACILDCGLHRWARRRRDRGLLFLSGPPRRVWSDLDAADRIRDGGAAEADVVRRVLCEGGAEGHGAFCVCAGWPLSAMITGDTAVGEWLELRSVLRGHGAGRTASPAVPDEFAGVDCSVDDLLTRDRVHPLCAQYVRIWREHFDGTPSRMWRPRFPVDGEAVRRLLRARGVGLGTPVPTVVSATADGSPLAAHAECLAHGENFAAARMAVGSLCVRLGRAFALHPSTGLAWMVDGCEAVLSHAGFTVAALLWELIVTMLWREGVATGRLTARVSPLPTAGPSRAGDGPGQAPPLTVLRPAPGRVSRVAAEQAVAVWACPDSDDSLVVPEAVRQRVVAAGRVRCALYCYPEARTLLGDSLFDVAAVPLSLRAEIVGHVTFFHTTDPGTNCWGAPAGSLVTGTAQLTCSPVMAAMQLERLRSVGTHGTSTGEVIVGFGCNAVIRVQCWRAQADGILHLGITLAPGRWRSSARSDAYIRKHRFEVVIQGSAPLLRFVCQAIAGLHFGAGLHVGSQRYYRGGSNVVPPLLDRVAAPSADAWGSRTCPGPAVHVNASSWLPHEIAFDIRIPTERLAGGTLRMTAHRDARRCFGWEIDGVAIASVAAGSPAEALGCAKGMCFVS